MKRLQIAFIVVALTLLSLPSLGMLWSPTTVSTENRTLAALPTVADGNGNPNINYLSQLGTYFDEHFAYRNELVTLNAKLRVGTFGVSPYPTVIVSKDAQGDPWAFYNSTVNDYVGAAPMTDEQLATAASNLAQMQNIAEASGAKFLFVIAPNKNSIYPENMPSLYLRSSEPTNSERLVPYLDEQGVNYLNLFELLRQAKAASPERLLYYKTDSHWNNIGAFIAANAISETLGIDPLDEPTEWLERADYLSDLGSILYPTASELEVGSYFGGINDEPNLAGASWSYDNEATSTFDDTVITTGQGTGTMLVYRDSFANTLIPYLATQTKEAYFTRLVPYDTALITSQAPDYVIVERAERHLDYFADAPLLQ